MRVALDVTPLTTGSTGVARYVRELWRELGAAGVGTAPFAIGRGRLPAPVGVRHYRVPLRVAHATWARAGIPRAEWLVRGPVDLVHCLDMVPSPTRRPLVMTACDVAAVDRPDLHSPRQTEIQLGQLDGFRRADLVLAISEATATALRQHGVPAERLLVTPLGVSPVARSVVPPPIGGPYLLAVGELAARKDLPTLIRAFHAARLPAGMKLVLVGPPGYRSEETTALVGGTVVATGKVDEPTLAALYAGANGLCFPSLSEGFGLPLLEAMARGVPVAASDIDVLRETAGSAAIYAAAGDVGAWARTLERLVDDETLRSGLASEGRARAAKATWARTAAATINGYERLVACG